jgi:hypothetical protein
VMNLATVRMFREPVTVYYSSNSLPVDEDGC